MLDTELNQKKSIQSPSIIDLQNLIRSSLFTNPPLCLERSGTGLLINATVSLLLLTILE